MLVLSRKPGETIRIGDDIEVSVMEVKGDTVRIGITAPRTVPIFRQELLAEVARTNIESVRAVPESMTVLNTLLRTGKEKKNGGGSK